MHALKYIWICSGCTIGLMVTLCLLDALLFAKVSPSVKLRWYDLSLWGVGLKKLKRAWYSNSLPFEIKNYKGTPVYLAEGFPGVFQWDLPLHCGHPWWFPPFQASNCSSWEWVAVIKASHREKHTNKTKPLTCCSLAQPLLSPLTTGLLGLGWEAHVGPDAWLPVPGDKEMCISAFAIMSWASRTS